MTFHLDPPVTPSPTHAWRHSGDSVEVLPARAHVIFHVLRIYEFTDLPPSLPLSSGTPQTRNWESSYRRWEQLIVIRFGDVGGPWKTNGNGSESQKFKHDSR